MKITMSKTNYNEVVKQLYHMCPKEVQERINQKKDLYTKKVRYHSFFTDENYYKLEVDYEAFCCLVLEEVEKEGLIWRE